MPDDGFHEGELLVQRRAGVAAEAQRLAGMVSSAHLSGGMARFVAERDLVFVTAEDDQGHLWTSPVFGPPGFAAGHDRALTMSRTVAADDPLRDLPVGRPVGVLLVDFARRRRLRVNGTVSESGPDRLAVVVEQAYGNCPRYIHPRRLVGIGDDHDDDGEAHARRSTRLAPEDVDQIVHADTFVLGTHHPERGADASHRGGEPGFVRHEDGELWWPDYPGNNLFNSLGNLAVDPAASLLFLDLDRGAVLQLSGRASVEWDADEETGRRVRFTPELVVSSHVPYRADQD
ncbi:pyridoxamine 5'-phosphate oxidase family protein [Actinomycetospora endophytica]|uniref:Pyridoxamine 5'-phosphate oxidase family protein n=1 Tax=Actinomycetospora endophytica TaxID=2291215 RepID=A0ABS8PAW1_9PSEU|nr:pyridoxamine 5'-phosphate oxidase family protein [Actinomycetospora endophytica]MCD2195392.1 pyridoxamine 5'-phosphate oxidase family protein [Actinomycetospora endophytica]